MFIILPCFAIIVFHFFNPAWIYPLWLLFCLNFALLLVCFISVFSSACCLYLFQIDFMFAFLFLFILPCFHPNYCFLIHSICFSFYNFALFCQLCSIFFINRAWIYPVCLLYCFPLVSAFVVLVFCFDILFL